MGASKSLNKPNSQEVTVGLPVSWCIPAPAGLHKIILWFIIIGVGCGFLFIEQLLLFIVAIWLHQETIVIFTQKNSDLNKVDVAEA